MSAQVPVYEYGMSKRKTVLFSGVMVAVYWVPKAWSGDAGETGMMRFGAI